MPDTRDVRVPGESEPVTIGPLCGVGYSSSYAVKCMRADLSLYIEGGGTSTSTPHHRSHGEVSLRLMPDGGGTSYSHGNVVIRATVPITLCLSGEGIGYVKGAPHVGIGSTADTGLTFGVCADVTTLSPVKVYCNDLSVLLPTLTNHLPEVEGYMNAAPSHCMEGMPGESTRYYPHEPGACPPPSVWQSLQDVELRILQESPMRASPYGYHYVWLLADLWYRGQQVMYLRNGEASTAPSRHIINRDAFNALVMYLSRALGMPEVMRQSPPLAGASLSTDISMVSKWGMYYTHRH